MEKLKITLENLSELAIQNHNKELLGKVGELKGLLIAYEMVNSIELLEKMMNMLCDLTVFALQSNINNITKVSNVMKASNNRFNKEGELANFYIYLTTVDGRKETTADAYRKTINKIIKDNNLGSLEEFEVSVDHFLQIYTEKDLHGELKDNGRILSAIKQYKKYLNKLNSEERDMLTYEQNKFIEEYEDYLRKQGYAESSTTMYSRRIKRLFKEGYSVDDLIGSLDKLINDYSNGGSKFDPKDHNNTSSALKRVADYLNV